MNDIETRAGTLLLLIIMFSMAVWFTTPKPPGPTARLT